MTPPFYLIIMIVFIGLGLHDEKDITLKGLEEARSCDELYAEFYTSILEGTTLEKISSLIGKEVKLLDRKDLEENAENTILKNAGSKKVGLLVAGDPLISTTHVQIRLQAQELGIETRAIHNASIYSASASISGLQNYKFGRSVTIPFAYKGCTSDRPYEVIKHNLDDGLHTLCFLDLDVEENRYLTLNEALETLLNIEKKKPKFTISLDTFAVGLARLGSSEQVVKADTVKRLRAHDFGSPPHTLIFPGKLHFMEAEALITLAKAPHRIRNQKR